MASSHAATGSAGFFFSLPSSAAGAAGAAASGSASMAFFSCFASFAFRSASSVRSSRASSSSSSSRTFAMVVRPAARKASRHLLISMLANHSSTGSAAAAAACSSEGSSWMALRSALMSLLFSPASSQMSSSTSSSSNKVRTEARSVRSADWNAAQHRSSPTEVSQSRTGSGLAASSLALRASRAFRKAFASLAFSSAASAASSKASSSSRSAFNASKVPRSLLENASTALAMSTDTSHWRTSSSISPASDDTWSPSDSFSPVPFCGTAPGCCDATGQAASSLTPQDICFQLTIAASENSPDTFPRFTGLPSTTAPSFATTTSWPSSTSS
mmetsp:Transcript_64763/g.173506  ORF Transcript_64763/g.173506 Transcript_64763/m.173506 type:complete len:330 (-) Transcript_64763:3862-4851(-)